MRKPRSIFSGSLRRRVFHSVVEVSPICKKDLTGVMYTCMNAICPTFCAEISGDVEKSVSKTLTSADMISRRTRLKRTPPGNEATCNA